MNRRLLLAFSVVLALVAPQFVNASGGTVFNGHIDGTDETFAGYLEFAQELGKPDMFRLRSNRLSQCEGLLYHKLGVIYEAVIKCKDGRTGYITLRHYGKNFVTEASLGGRKLWLSMPNYEYHRSR